MEELVQGCQMCTMVIQMSVNEINLYYYFDIVLKKKDKKKFFKNDLVFKSHIS